MKSIREYLLLSDASCGMRVMMLCDSDGEADSISVSEPLMTERLPHFDPIDIDVEHMEYVIRTG